MSESARGESTDTPEVSSIRESVLPEPKKIEMLSDTQGELPFCGSVVLGQGVDQFRVTQQLLDDIELITASRWDITRMGSGVEHESDSVTGADVGCIRIDISDLSGKHGEYRLRVARGTQSGSLVVSILGQDEEGVRNGVQTLRQLLRANGTTLPYVEIHDWPDFAARGYYLDVTRGRVPKLEWLKSWIDELSFYKYNQLQLYVEHSYEFQGLSQMWGGHDPLSAEDLMEIGRYCASVGIDFVPSIATFGHLYEMLKTKKFCNLSEFPQMADRPFSFVERMNHHTLNPVNPRSMELSESLIDEYAGLFTSRYFNIGGDETFDLGRGESKRQAEKVGTNSLYASYISKLCKKIVADDKVPMMWADILLNDPSMASDLPDDTIFLNWEYGEIVSEEKNEKIEKTGHRYYVCPGVSSWNRLVPSIHAAWVNISQMARFGALHHAEGMLTTDWGDFGHVNDPRLSAPGMVMAAEYSWNPATAVSYDVLVRRVAKVEYHDSQSATLQAMGSVDPCALFDWSSIVMYKEMGDSQEINAEVFTRQFGKEPGNQDTDTEVVRANLLKSLPLGVGEIEEAEARLNTIRRSITPSLGFEAHGNWPYLRTPLMTALRGVALWNRVGGLLRDPDAPRLSTDGATTANQLESWWLDYARTWNEISRPSELERLHEVVKWYAERLRAAVGGQREFR